MDILLLIVECLEDLSKGNPSPNAFRERLEAIRAEVSRVERDRLAGGKEDATAEDKTNEGGSNALG